MERAGEKDEEESTRGRDPYLEARLARYDAWVGEGSIPYSSRVVPIQRSIEAAQWVLPVQQIAGILGRARSIALAECVCRSHYQRCGNPLEMCLRLDQSADSCVERGKGRYVSVEEALDVLGKADERGLVHMAVYIPEQQVYALCSCCSCCCHELQYLQRYGRKDLVARSDYVAQTDQDACTGCGECLDRCLFHARFEEEGRVIEDADACYGCGLCVTACPTQAIRLRPRRSLQQGGE